MKIRNERIKESTFIKIENDNGMKVILSSCGAGLYSINIKGNEMLLSYEDKSFWLESKGYQGKVLGKVAGRIDGKDYPEASNEDGVILHGGKKSYSFIDWSIDSIGEDDDGARIAFSLTSQEDGLKGRFKEKIVYLIDKYENRIRIDFLTECLENGIHNIAIHPYFTLGEEDISGLSLSFKAKAMERYDSRNLPTGMGEIENDYDFSSGKILSSVRLDHCFLLEDGKLCLEGKKIRLEMRTDFPCFQIYDDGYPQGKMILGSKRIETIHSGLAIEPMGNPDAMSKKEMDIGRRNGYIEYDFCLKQKGGLL